MSNITISIKTDNDSFHFLDEEDNNLYEPTMEVARILRELANKIEQDGQIESGQRLNDHNGAAVGSVEHNQN